MNTVVVRFVLLTTIVVVVVVVSNALESETSGHASDRYEDEDDRVGLMTMQIPGTPVRDIYKFWIHVIACFHSLCSNGQRDVNACVGRHSNCCEKKKQRNLVTGTEFHVGLPFFSFTIGQKLEAGGYTVYTCMWQIDAGGRYDLQVHRLVHRTRWTRSNQRKKRKFVTSLAGN